MQFVVPCIIQFQSIFASKITYILIAALDILGADEVFAAACSPVDASLVVSGGKDDRGFLWRIGSAEDVQELPGIYGS